MFHVPPKLLLRVEFIRIEMLLAREGRNAGNTTYSSSGRSLSYCLGHKKRTQGEEITEYVTYRGAQYRLRTAIYSKELIILTQVAKMNS